MDSDEIQGHANGTEGEDGDSFFVSGFFFLYTSYIYKRSKKHHIVGLQNLRSKMMDQKDEKKEHVSLSSLGELNHHVWTQLSTWGLWSQFLMRLRCPTACHSQATSPSGNPDKSMGMK